MVTGWICRRLYELSQFSAIFLPSPDHVIRYTLWRGMLARVDRCR